MMAAARRASCSVPATRKGARGRQEDGIQELQGATQQQAAYPRLEDRVRR
jgi:hypothetical protein